MKQLGSGKILNLGDELEGTISKRGGRLGKTLITTGSSSAEKKVEPAKKKTKHRRVRERGAEGKSDRPHFQL